MCWRFSSSCPSDQLNGVHVRATRSEQLWRCEASAGLEAALVPRPGAHAFPETPLLHLRRQILWWEDALDTVLISRRCFNLSPWERPGWFLTLAFSCLTLQVSTTAFTAARAVKASSSGRCARIWPIPAGTIKTALWTRDSGTAASTAVTRSAWPWGWRGKVREERLWNCFMAFSRLHHGVCFWNYLEKNGASWESASVCLQLSRRSGRETRSERAKWSPPVRWMRRCPWKRFWRRRWL